MKGGFRDSMTWLHTWSSLLMGWLLFAVFLTGTLVFFRSEINHWMMPELHGSEPGADAAQLGYRYLVEQAPNAEQWRIILPDARERSLQLQWRNPGDPPGRRGGHSQLLDAGSGEPLAPRETAGANFLYRFHFELYGIDRQQGRIIVGIASMLMLVGIITGIIAHKAIFKDFFAFRTRKSLRGLLDGHAITAVFALPFHLMITWSGLVLLAGTLLFWNNDARRFDDDGQREAAEVRMPASPNALPLAAMLATTEAQWQAPVRAISIQWPLTEQAEVELASSYRRQLSSGRGGGASLRFNSQGEIVEQQDGEPAANAIAATWNTLSIAHQGRFAEPLLRALYFVAGVLGCIMIATGLAYWPKKRRKQLGGKFGYELVCALNIAAVAGLCIASAAYFWANRLIPATLENRAALEISVFFSVWLLSLLHAAVTRNRRGWAQQCFVAALLCMALPVLDAATSPVGLGLALLIADWPRLGVDLVAVALGACLLYTAWVLAAGGAASRQSQSLPARQPSNNSRRAEIAAKESKV